MNKKDYIYLKGSNGEIKQVGPNEFMAFGPGRLPTNFKTKDLAKWIKALGVTSSLNGGIAFSEFPKQ
jgi:hypothetical protein